MRTLQSLLLLFFTQSLFSAPQFSTENIEGWTVYLNKSANNKAKNEARAFLAKDLRIIKQKVPNNALDVLQKISITVGRGSNKFWAKYSYGNKSVEFKSVKGFIDGRGVYPDVVLHEMAHGYHTLKIGLDYRKDSPDGSVSKELKQSLVAAWKRHKTDYSSLGKNALTPKNKPSNSFFLKWATLNQLEYFAEMSTTHYGVHRYWAEIKDKDSERVIGELWGEKKTGQIKEVNKRTFAHPLTRRGLRILMRQPQK